MSKRILYNGKDKWYQCDKQKGSRVVKVPIKIMRQITSSKVIVVPVNDPEEKICHRELIKQFENHQNNALFKPKNQLNEGNILFKFITCRDGKINLSANHLKHYSIICQSTKLAQYKDKKQYTKRLIEEAINGDKIALNLVTDNHSTFNYKKIDINVYSADENKKDTKFDKKANEYAILVKVRNEESIKIDNDIIDKMIKVNQMLYRVFDNLVKEIEGNQECVDTNQWQNVLYQKFIELFNKQEKAITEQLQCVLKHSDQDFVDHYVLKDQNELKKLLLHQLRSCDLESTEALPQMVQTFLWDLILSKQIIKRVIKMPGAIREKAQIKTYITHDRHTQHKEKNDLKNKVYQQLINKYAGSKNNLLNDITDILQEQNYQAIFADVVSDYNNGSKDTRLFRTYKKAYPRKSTFEDRDVISKFLHREIYRYSKGRVRKLIAQSSYIETIQKPDFVMGNRDSSLKVKIEQHIKAKMLSNILYQGKLVHEGLAAEQGAFEQFHAWDELFQELLVLFVTLNYELNQEILKADDFRDYVGKKEDDNKIIEHINTSTLRALSFSDGDEKDAAGYIKSFLEICRQFRSAIIHGNQKTLHDSWTKEEPKESWKQLRKIIQQNQKSDKTICQLLQITSVFAGKEDLITQMNALEGDEFSLQKYFPGFNHIVPLLKREIKYNKDISSDSKMVIENAALYACKILYLKEIVNPKSGFVKQLLKKMEITSQDDLIKYYKTVQKASAKGNYQSIRTYQRSIIDSFMTYVKDHPEYKKLLDFGDVQELEKLSDETLVLSAKTQEITIDNDFEFCVLQSLLLVDPVIGNYVLQRIKATAMWIAPGKEQEQLDALFEKASQLMALKKQRYQFYHGKGLEDIRIAEKKEQRERMISEAVISICRGLEMEYSSELGDVIKGYCEKTKKISDILSYVENSRKNEVIQILNNCNLQGKYQEKTQEIDQKIKIEIQSSFNKYETNLQTYIENVKDIADPVKEYYAQSNGDIIFRHSLYSTVNQPKFEKLFQSYYKEQLQSHHFLALPNEKEMTEIIRRVDQTLAIFNKNVKGRTKHFKTEIVKLIRQDQAIYKQYCGDQYCDFATFEQDYQAKRESISQKALLDFRYAYLFFEQVQLINYKLLRQIQLFERDMHYFVRGLESYGKKLYEDMVKGQDSAFKKKDNYYKWKEDGYQKFTEYCTWFNLPIDTTCVRNSVAHFDLLRDLFGSKSVLQRIDEVNQFMSYRSLYNNAALKASVETLKKSVAIDYTELNKKQCLTATLEQIIHPLSATSFELPSYLKGYRAFVLKWLKYQSDLNK